MSPTLRRSLTLLAVVVAVATTGCVTVPYRAHPDASQRLREMKTFVLLPPDVKVYELSAGGVTQLMDDWSAQGRRNASDAVTRILNEQAGVTVREFAPAADDSRLAEQYAEALALVDAIASTAVLHTYNPQLSLPGKREDFRYSVGPLPALAEAADADGLVFVSGVDHISTGGRKALMVVGVLLGAATGVYVGPAAGATRLNVAVVDARTGDVLWFNIAGAGGGSDLRDPGSVTPLATTLLSGFQPAPKKP